MERTAFRSKRDRWFTAIMVPSFALMVWTLLLLIPAKDLGARLIGLPVTVITLVLGVWVFVKTDYTLSGDTLLIRSGPFRWRIEAREIQRLLKTDDPSSAPALSLDRIMIVFDRAGERREILVSPADEAGFIGALKSRNPAIAVE